MSVSSVNSFDHLQSSPQSARLLGSAWHMVWSWWVPKGLILPPPKKKHSNLTKTWNMLSYTAYVRQQFHAIGLFCTKRIQASSMLLVLLGSIVILFDVWHWPQRRQDLLHWNNQVSHRLPLKGTWLLCESCTVLNPSQSHTICIYISDPGLNGNVM